MTRPTIFVPAALLAMVCSAAWAQAVKPATRPGSGSDVELSKRYIDPLNGFSLKPPANTDRHRRFSATVLVTWQKREPKTNAVLWTLTVQKALIADKNFRIAKYADDLVKKLARDEGFKLSSKSISTVADKASIHLLGTKGAGFSVRQRQVWVHVHPHRFLILTMTGPEDPTLVKEMDRTFQAVVDSLELLDPIQQLKLRRQNIARGQDLLDGLDAKTLTGALIDQPQWFLLTFKGKPAGFLYQEEGQGRHRGKAGLTLSTYVRLKLPGDADRLLRRDMFVTPDLQMERWREQLQVGSGDRAYWAIEEGLKQRDLIVCSTVQGGKSRSRQKEVPKQIYLPRLVSYLLPRLVDLKTENSYAFASYTSSANDFDMRTFTVIEPEPVTIDSRVHAATRCTDQPAADTEASSLWVDKDGKLLKMVTPDGLDMTSVSAESVRAQFPRARAVVEQMRKWKTQ